MTQPTEALWFGAAVPVAAAIIAVGFTNLWEIQRLFPHPETQPPTDGLAEGTAIAEFNKAQYALNKATGRL